MSRRFAAFSGESSVPGTAAPNGPTRSGRGVCNVRVRLNGIHGRAMVDEPAGGLGATRRGGKRQRRHRGAASLGGQPVHWQPAFDQPRHRLDVTLSGGYLKCGHVSSRSTVSGRYWREPAKVAVDIVRPSAFTLPPQHRRGVGAGLFRQRVGQWRGGVGRGGGQGEREQQGEHRPHAGKRRARRPVGCPERPAPTRGSPPPDAAPWRGTTVRECGRRSRQRFEASVPEDAGVARRTPSRSCLAAGPRLAGGSRGSA